MRRRSLALCLLALAACRGGRDSTAAAAGGRLVIATSADADALLPPLTATQTGRAVADNVFERLAEAPAGDTVATTGDAGWRPRLASSWTWGPDSLSLAFALDPRARFHDGVPVRARDVAFTFRLLRDPALGATTGALLGNIDSITVRDSLTAVAWFRRRTAERFFDVAYQLWILPAHLLDTVPPAQLRSHPLARRPVGSGRFRLVAWEPGERIVLAADSTHPRGRPGLDAVTWVITPDPSAAVARLTAGEADLLENPRGPQVAEVTAAPDVRLLAYRSRQVGTILLRVKDGAMPHPVLGDARVRRAITQSLDAAAIARNVFDTLGAPAGGPLPDATRPPRFSYDTAAAAAALDSAGWRRGPDGMRRRGTRGLAFSLLVPSVSRPRQQIATLVQEALRRAGIAVTIEQADMPAFVARLASRRFDAAIQVFSSDPSPFGLREQWGGAAARTPETANYTGWSSAAFDALLDSAETAGAAQVGDYLQRAIDVLRDDAPAVFLVQPRAAIALHRRLQPVGVREDGWWTDLADWTVAPDARLPRDTASRP
ncbi:MAG: peptide ABC transporter substrate-binding protein [Gemmatimonadetes bacterium]|jgi:peptide/nickel transport system substrate-binding protein|nr:peptide ABC transporter substrate-binding protein [Gemmatimonadota bacterium]